MIYQGLNNILSYYLKESSLLYRSLNDYFKKRIEGLDRKLKENEINQESIKKYMQDILDKIESTLQFLGFKDQDFTTTIHDPFIKVKESHLAEITFVSDVFDLIVEPIVNELVFKKICEYFVNINGQQILINLRKAEAFPLESLVEVRELKDLFDKNLKKQERLRNYIQLEDKIIGNYKEHKEQIESLEELKETRNKIQLIYLVYRIIYFFNLESIFDFTNIETYLKEHMDEWLTTIPLVTLKNPDLYFCGIYLAHHLDIDIDMEKVEEFISNLYLEYIDEFESPIMEGTCALYYYVKSIKILDIDIGDENVHKLIDADPDYFKESNLKQMETTCLAVILKIYKILGIFDQIETEKIQAIEQEINNRISGDVIKQYPDGLYSSEATYYVLFHHYMRDEIEQLKDKNLLRNIIDRIYRNLEVLDFSEDTSYDLLSELFYSCESLKLLNCIEEKAMLLHLAKYLFPQEISDAIENSTDFTFDKTNFRHLGVSKRTGETIY
ncbi:MAG: hypothetical protein BAJALOKI1v1_1420002 [Promethearchaeota archaeon]|nr:MAG: hypothetical protein BAJALOKI1v1_1420002 [Candidatus Lokiarchaeota archaeon]